MSRDFPAKPKMRRKKITRTPFEPCVVPHLIRAAIRRFGISRPSPQPSASSRLHIPDYFPQPFHPLAHQEVRGVSSSTTEFVNPSVLLAVSFTLTHLRIVQPTPAYRREPASNNSKRHPSFQLFQISQLTSPSPPFLPLFPANCLNCFPLPICRPTSSPAQIITCNFLSPIPSNSQPMKPVPYHCLCLLIYTNQYILIIYRVLNSSQC